MKKLYFSISDPAKNKYGDWDFKHIDILNNKPICPECGKEMVVRKSKFGEFYGCAGFPKCKSTFDIKVANRIVKAMQESELPENTPEDKYLITINRFNGSNDLEILKQSTLRRL